RNTVVLETVERSMGPENGIEIRGWTLNPSRVSRTSMSAQSEGWVTQSGLGRLMRNPVICASSGTVWRLLGNGCPAFVAAAATPGNTSASDTEAKRERMAGLLSSAGWGLTAKLLRWVPRCQRKLQREGPGPLSERHRVTTTFARLCPVSA